MSEKQIGQVSSSSIRTFKTCPVKYKLAYIEGIREAVEPQPFRMGTAWHKGREILETPLGQTAETGFGVTNVITEENRLELAIQYATEVYETIPDQADPTDWAVEREIIANGLAAVHWLYGSDSPYETVATELQFELPLVNPETGRSTPSFKRVGKIDRIIRVKATEALMIQEYKTTARPIDSGSTYWARLRKDTQSKFYILAGRNLQSDPNSPLHPLAAVAQVSGLFHDVYHKPQIGPKKLTQAESAEFVKTGQYMGQTFTVGVSEDDAHLISVDGVIADKEPGKKEGTFALRETPAMFGARLFADLTGNKEVYSDAKGPGYYFARREVPFTDQELKAFEYQIWALQRNMAEVERTGFYYENEMECEPTGGMKCQYCSICFNNVDVSNGNTPPGFKRLAHAMSAELGAPE